MALTQDSYHSGAVEGLRAARAARRRVFTTNFVVAEAHALFLARSGRQAALAFLDGLAMTGIATLRITPDDEAAALGILRRYRDKDFSFVDALSFAMMRRFRCEVALTSDHHFAQFGFRRAGLD